PAAKASCRTPRLHYSPQLVVARGRARNSARGEPMALRSRKLLLVVLLIGALFYSPCPVFSSGPFFPRAVFTYTTHPDLPLEKFVHGELGILQPTYEGPALYLAYRYLIGTGFDAEEQEVYLNVWNIYLRM